MDHLALVLEDNPFVRRSVRDALIAQGLTVVTAESVSAANRLMLARGAHFSILVTDIHLPDGSGWKVARAARHIWPDVPVLYMSADHHHDFDGRAVPHSALLPKPFDSAGLSHAMASLGMFDEAGDTAALATVN